MSDEPSKGAIDAAEVGSNHCNNTQLDQWGLLYRRLGNARFNITVFIPPDRGNITNNYYRSSRFDWSSMIGNVCIGPMVVFPDAFWEGPHNSADVDAGMGFAEEFGCNETGATCQAGGLNSMEESSNGILGWEDGGDEFLKIGVGKLLKIPGEEDYDPRKTYQMSGDVIWNVRAYDVNTLVMEISQTMGDWGYSLRKRVHVITAFPPVVVIETNLVNTGNGTTIRTPHYSHNFLNDKEKIDTFWSVYFGGMDITSYESNKLQDFLGALLVSPDGYNIGVVRALTEQIKTWFVGANNSDAADTFRVENRDSRNLTIESTQTTNNIQELYRYLFYTSPTTLSPMPMHMIHLAPGEEAFWSRRIAFNLEGYEDPAAPWAPPGWAYGISTSLLLGTTLIAMQFKGRAMKIMDSFKDDNEEMDATMHKLQEVAQQETKELS